MELNQNKFTLGGFVFCLSFEDGRSGLKFPDDLQPYETKDPPDFHFSVSKIIPTEWESLSQERMHWRGWELYDWNGATLFKQMANRNTNVRLYAFIDKKERTCAIHYKELKSAVYYPFEDIFFYDLLAQRCAGFIHASGITWNGKAYLFTGFSGVGKSTIAGLLQAVPGVTVLSDERILLVQRDQKIWAYGTPWCSSLRINSPAGAPLEGIFFLGHGKQNSITPVNPGLASAFIFRQFFTSKWDNETLSANLNLIQQVATTVPSYAFDFLPDPSAVDYFMRFQNG